MAINHENTLITLLMAGPMATKAICGKMAISPPTLNRVVKRLGNRIVCMGKARATQYACPRRALGLESCHHVYRVGQEGNVALIGQLVLVQPSGYWFEHKASVYRSKFYPSIPWFICDMRHDGFVGRAFAHGEGVSLGLPAKLNDWSDDHIIAALVRRGEDAIGDLLIGDESVTRYMTSAITCGTVSQDCYPDFAEKAVAGEPAGSSAGGEQPKFTCLVERNGIDQNVLVKFSPPLDSESGQRWSDLLVCEHIALETVNDCGIRSVANRLLQLGNRTFLEVERFDRIGRHGRSPIHSLGAVDDEYYGLRDNWTSAANRMFSDKRLSREDCSRLIWLDSFGELIANTDRHFGNISLIPTDDAREKFALAPAYDMLPMYYRPRDSGVVCDTYTPSPLVRVVQGPNNNTLDAAIAFWEKTSEHPMISNEFRQICKANLAEISSIQERPRLLSAIINA